PPGANVFDRAQSRTPNCEIVEVRATSVPMPLRRDVLDRHHPIAPVEAKRGTSDSVDCREGECSDGDGDGHPENTDQRQSRILREHTKPELEVERQSTEPRRTASVAQRLAVFLHPAKGDECL